MKKERIKSFILILLIVNSVNLTLQLWFDSKLWPSGYGFLDTVKNSSVVSGFFSWLNGDDAAYSGEQLHIKTMKPRRVVVNGGGAREVYMKDSDYYNEAMQYVDIAISELEDADVSVREISYEEWKNLFKAKSLYVDYGYLMDSAGLNQLYGMDLSVSKFNDASDFSGFIIVPDTVTNSFSICTLNETNNTVKEYKYAADPSLLLNFIEKTTYQKQQNDTFAFEINLDTLTSTEDSVERKVAFSPLTLLTIPTETENDTVLKNNPIFKDYEEFEAFSERVLSVFGYTASSLRKNVQSNGTITFVENKATIKFYYDGTIEYHAVSKENGLKISNGTSCYQAVCDVLKVAGTVWEKSGIDSKNLDYQLVSDLVDNKNNKYKVRIDNVYNGVAIHYSNITNSAVMADVEEGYITGLVIHLSNISETEQKRESVPVLVAIDAVYEEDGNGGMIIDDVYKCYDFGNSDRGIAKWAFKVRGDENILVMDMEDLY